MNKRGCRSWLPIQPLREVLRHLEGQDVNQVPVVVGDRLVGIITRDHLLRVPAVEIELEFPIGPGPIRASGDAVEGRTVGSQ